MTNTDETLRPVAATQDSIELKVASVFRSLLPKQGDDGEEVNISADMDFFDLGGNSMLAARLVVKLRQELEVNVSIRDVFRGRTVRAISQAVRDGHEG